MTVYLLHFNERYHHAGHYVGYTDDLETRLARHRQGNGARLIEVITDAGIGFVVALCGQMETARSSAGSSAHTTRPAIARSAILTQCRSGTGAKTTPKR